MKARVFWLARGAAFFAIALPRDSALSFSSAPASRGVLTRRLATAAAPSVQPEVDFDLVVLGAGPVGVSAALAAAELGKRVCLVDAPAFSGALMKDGEDLSLGGPTGLFSKALRDTSKRISVSTLRGMGISEQSIWSEVNMV